MLLKNAAQKIHVYAYDSTTGAAKTGDAANITAYVSLDGTANAVDDTNPAEVDSTNMPGVYVFDLTAEETNCDAFALYAKSATSNIRLEPIIGFTTAGAATGVAVSSLVANAITATVIADDAITAAKLNTGAITADAFAADAIVAATLATGAITADAFAADAIVAATLATGVLTADAFAANAITNAAVADDVDVNVKTITAGAITAATFAADVDAEVAAYVWNAATASYGTAGTYGLLLESGNVGGGSIVAASVTGAVGSVTGAVGSVTGAVGSVTGNVGGNVTGSVGSVATGGIAAASFAAGAIDAAAIATNAIDADSLAADAGTEIADAILSRNVSNVEASAAEHTLCTVVLAMLEHSISSTTLTIKRTDGSTTHATKTLTTNAAAEPITGIT